MNASDLRMTHTLSLLLIGAGACALFGLYWESHLLSHSVRQEEFSLQALSEQQSALKHRPASALKRSARGE